MTEKDLRKRLRELVEWMEAGAYTIPALRLVKLLTDWDEPADPLKEHHPEIAAWYEKHADDLYKKYGKGGKWSVGPVTGGYPPPTHGPDAADCPRREADKNSAPSSVGVHTCYEGCTHPAHEGAPVPLIGTEPLADPDDAHVEIVKPIVIGLTKDGPVEMVVSEPVNEVWSHYVSAHPDHKTCRLTAPRKRVIQARLKEGYTVAQLKDAITGFHLSPWHTGENPDKKKWLDFELMVRDGGQVEKGLGCLRDARQMKAESKATDADLAAQEAEIRATVDAALAMPIPPPPAPPAPEDDGVEFL